MRRYFRMSDAFLNKMSEEERDNYHKELFGEEWDKDIKKIRKPNNNATTTQTKEELQRN